MSEPNPVLFGAKLRSYRDAAGFTQSDAAEAAGVKREYLASLELGRIQVPYPHVFNALHTVLRFPGWELLEALGFETDHEDSGLKILPALASELRKMSEDQQKAVLGVVKAMAKAS